MRPVRMGSRTSKRGKDRCLRKQWVLVQSVAGQPRESPTLYPFPVTLSGLQAALSTHNQIRDLPTSFSSYFSGMPAPRPTWDMHPVWSSLWQRPGSIKAASEQLQCVLQAGSPRPGPGDAGVQGVIPWEG